MEQKMKAKNKIWDFCHQIFPPLVFLCGVIVFPIVSWSAEGGDAGGVPAVDVPAADVPVVSDEGKAAEEAAAAVKKTEEAAAKAERKAAKKAEADKAAEEAAKKAAEEAAAAKAEKKAAKKAEMDKAAEEVAKKAVEEAAAKAERKAAKKAELDKATEEKAKKSTEEAAAAKAEKKAAKVKTAEVPKAKAAGDKTPEVSKKEGKKGKNKVELTPEELATRTAYDRALTYVVGRVDGENRDEILESLQRVINSYSKKELGINSNYNSNSSYNSYGNGEPEEPTPYKLPKQIQKDDYPDPIPMSDEDIEYDVRNKYFGGYNGHTRLNKTQEGYKEQQDDLTRKIKQEITKQRKKEEDDTKRIKRKYEDAMETYEADKDRIKKQNEKAIEKYKKDVLKYEAGLKEKKEKKNEDKKKDTNTKVKDMLDTFFASYKRLLEKDVFPTQLLIYEELSDAGRQAFLTKIVKDLFSSTIFADAQAATQKTKEGKSAVKQEKQKQIVTAILPLFGKLFSGSNSSAPTGGSPQLQDQGPSGQQPYDSHDQQYNAHDSYGQNEQKARPRYNSFESETQGALSVPLQLIAYDDDYGGSSSYDSSSYGSSSYGSDSYSSSSSNYSSSSSSSSSGKKQIPLIEIIFNKDQYLRFAISEIDNIHGTCGSFKSCLEADKKKLNDMLSKSSKKNKGWPRIKAVLDILNSNMNGDPDAIPKLSDAVEQFKKNDYEGIPSSLKSIKGLKWAKKDEERKETQKKLGKENNLFQDKIIVENLVALKTKYQVLTPKEKKTKDKIDFAGNVFGILGGGSGNPADKDAGQQGGLLGTLGGLFGGKKADKKKDKNGDDTSSNAFGDALSMFGG